MSTDIQPRSSVFRQYVLVAILFVLLASIVIGKAILLDNCMAFDVSDDFNHTFTGLEMAKQMLRNGAMPYFNYYNNFGTPLMGDALTYPFAIHAIPYYLTDIANYPLVSTINRFVLCLATLASLVVFYRTFQLSIFSSAIAAMCVFFNFGFFWHFAHHSYQTTVLFAVCIFTLQRNSILKNRWFMLFFSVALVSALMIYSVNPNLIVLCFAFFVLHPLFYGSLKAISINTLALFAGGMLGSLQIITNVLALMNSVRSGKTYADVFFIKFSWPELIYRVLFQDRPSGVHLGHVYLVAYFPMFLIVAFVAGLYLLSKDKKNNAFALSCVLGLIPLLTTGVLLVYSGLWKAMPLFKSTDITRILWVAMIFIGVGIGTFSDALRSRTIGKQTSLMILFVMTIAACLCTFFVVTGRSPAIYLPGYWLFWTLLMLYASQQCMKKFWHNTLIYSYVLCKWRLIAGVGMLITVICTYSPIVHYLGNWSNPAMCRSLNYFTDIPAFDPELGRDVKTLHKSARFAFEVGSVHGMELILETFARHGGGGLSVALDSKLNALLLSRGLIENDNPFSGYHFTNPWDTSISNRLGLRYFGTEKSEVHSNWKIIDIWGQFYIYENESKPSIVYISDGQNKIIGIESFRIEGNDIVIDMPRTINGGMLYVTITARPGFSMFIDGKRQAFDVDEFGFMRVNVTPSHKTVRVSYNPLEFAWLFRK